MKKLILYYNIIIYIILYYNFYSIIILYYNITIYIIKNLSNHTLFIRKKFSNIIEHEKDFIFISKINYIKISRYISGIFIIIKNKC